MADQSCNAVSDSSQPLQCFVPYKDLYKMKNFRYLRRVQLVDMRQSMRVNHQHPQRLHATPSLLTDGVYKDLTEMRVRTPWIEALRKQRQEGIDPTKKSGTSATPADRDLTPKKMSDSFHRVVRRPRRGT